MALDRQEIVHGESSIEKGRLFDGWYSSDRRHAQAQVARRQASFGDRLSRRADVVIQEVLDAADSRRANPSEERTGAALSPFVNQLEVANTGSGSWRRNSRPRAGAAARTR